MAGDDEGLVFVGVIELIGVGDCPSLFRVRERALGEIGIGRLQRFANGFQTDAVAIELVRVRLDADSRTGAAPGENLADTFHLCEFLREDGIRGVVNLRGRDVVRGQRKYQDRRVGRIDFSICGLAGKIGGKLAASGVDGGLNVARGRVDVAIEIELKSNARGAEAARGSHLRDAGNTAELALEGSGDGGGHSLRARARQTGAHANGWEIDARERSDRQETERDNTGKKNSNGDQRRGDRTSNEGRGKVAREIHRSITRNGSLSRFFDGVANVKCEAACKPIECEINNGGGVKGQQLAEDKPADDSDTQRTTQFRADATAERERQATEQRGHGSHHDGAETKQASFVDGIERRLPFLALGLQCEVDHHDGVFLDDADEQDDADQRDDAEFRVAEKQRENRPDARRRERGENRDRMNVAFVENAENDVDGNQGSQDQDGLIGQRLEEGRRGALERGLDAGWHVQFQLRAVDGVDRVAERGIGGQIERESDDRKLTLMIECEGGGAGLETRKGAERDLCAVGRLYVNVFQRIGILLELRIDFHDHVILVELGKNCGDLALAKGIVERVVNVCRKNAKSRSGVAVDGERSE